MESLGGDQLWVDRFMAQHAAIIYYFILLLMFVASPPLAYNFSELIEAHAVDTYGERVGVLCVCVLVGSVQQGLAPGRRGGEKTAVCTQNSMRGSSRSVV
jgi:hypothetical protein